MKKILIVAALLATSVMPATSVSAAGTAAAAPAKPSLACLLLPLLPDCMAAWKADGHAIMSKMAPKKMAMAAPMAPMMPKMPNCTKAAAGAGHLFDCKM